MPNFVLFTPTDPANPTGDGSWVDIDTITSGGLPPVTGVPGAVIIENATGTAYEQRRLRQSDIDPNFAISSFSLGGASLIETGSVYNNPSFTATYNVPVGQLSQADVQDNQGGAVQDVLGTPNAFSYTGSYGGLAGPLGTPNASVQWTLTANNGVSGSSVNDSVTSATRTYYGPATIPGAVDEAFIEGLANSQLRTNRNLNYTITMGVAEYGWHALPTRLGTPTAFVDGFEIILVTAATNVSVTNALGFTENYDVYRTTNPNLGSTTFNWS